MYTQSIIIKLCYSGVVHLALPCKGRLLLRGGRYSWDIEVFHLCVFTKSVQSTEWVFGHKIPNRSSNSFENKGGVLCYCTFS